MGGAAMRGRFNGQIGEGSRAKVGPVPQRDLVRLLCVLIDASRAKSGTRTRDEARAALRALMAEANWDTPYVRKNLGARRCRYLSGLGYRVAAADMARSTIERLEDWSRRNG